MSDHGSFSMGEWTALVVQWKNLLEAWVSFLLDAPLSHCHGKGKRDDMIIYSYGDREQSHADKTSRQSPFFIHLNSKSVTNVAERT